MAEIDGVALKGRLKNPKREEVVADPAVHVQRRRVNPITCKQSFSIGFVSLPAGPACLSSCRQQRLNGIDPIEARNAARLEQKLATARQVTFRHCAEGWVATQQIRIGGIGDLVPMGPETPGVHAKADSSS